ncbi:hypothetical protein VTK26DRAFT_8902 [Humicola hyalothermophila]
MSLATTANLPPDLDLSTLTTSADIFSTSSTNTSTNSATTTIAAAASKNAYTLPQIRAIHAHLQHQAADASARLRTRVGASYRDLLGTADAIVGMRADMDAVLALLGDMGARCGAGVVAGKGKGLRRFAEVEAKGKTFEAEGGEGNIGVGGGRDGGTAAAAAAAAVLVGQGRGRGTGIGKGLGEEARRRLLAGCLLGLEGELRRRKEGTEKGGETRKQRGEGLLLAARLYVLGRLLVKSFGEQGMTEQKVRAAKKSLETVHRARLMAGVDAVLRSASENAMRRGDVLKALAAYSLAETAGARDVLRYLLRVRSEAIAITLDMDEDDRTARNPKDVLKALGLYTKTLLDVQALVPHKLTEALVALKEERLLDNASLKETEALRLDIYRRWCGDEIQFYTPFIRHDDLDGAEARKMLASWANTGSQVLLQGLERTLERMTEFKAIVELRTSVLKLWIAQGAKARGFDPSVMLDKLREAINKHLLRVLEAKVAKLRLVGAEVSATLDAWREGTTDRHQSLWDVDSFDMDLSTGAAQFTQDVVARLHGRNDAVSKVVTSYGSWFHVVNDVGQVVDQLRRQRWDNDVDEIEDEETIEERQQLLAKDDPLALSEHLSRLLIEAFRRLEDQLSTLWNSRREGPDNGAIAMYFVRLLRDIRAKLPDLDAVKNFGLALVPSLHESVAAAVVVSPLDEFATVALARKTVVGRGLWDGEPALPGSPSPGAFRFLRNLTTAMGDAGGDLWSPAAVAALKRQLCSLLAEAWQEAFSALNRDVDGANDMATPKSDGDGNEAKESEAAEQGAAEKSAADSAKRDLLVQWLLDIYYLRLFIAPPQTSSQDAFTKLEEDISRETGLGDSPAKEKLAKTSQDYFKKTGLLFGLLT